MRKALVYLGILNDHDLEWMISAGAARQIAQGAVLIEEGKAASSLFVVLDGEFSVTVGGAARREVARLKSGEILGEISFVDSRPPTATVMANQASRVLDIPRRAIEQHLSEDSGFATRFYRAVAVFLADRLRNTVGMLGYGAGASLDAEASYADELEMGTLDDVSLGAARFRMLQRRLASL